LDWHPAFKWKKPMSKQQPPDSVPDIQSRKADHLALCATDKVAFTNKTTLLEQVELVHDALPDIAIHEIDLAVNFAGKTLAAPLLIAAMTGGVAEAEAINRDLAGLAEELGIGFGFGSQRPLLEDGIQAGYAVRDRAPSTLILGNIGIVQARKATTSALHEMVAASGADALCVHLNPAMEVIQAGGDQDFRGGIETLERLHRELGVPIVVKETGCGLSRSVGQRIRAVGIEWVDCSGAGGTSWVGVETLRARAKTQALGERFWDWGIPTAASVAQLNGLGLGVCATGGIQNGLDVAKAMALGARCGGMARPVLQAYAQGGTPAARELLLGVIDEIRLACLLTGCKSPMDLVNRPVRLGATLRDWVPSGTDLARRSQA
jgi:isopentenyl-diphosphate delta-isomerase